MLYPTDDLRITWTKVVLPPVFLEEELPITEKASATVFKARTEIINILNGKDNRLLVVVGPCSIHDTDAAREYAELLKGVIAEFSQELCLVMRVYFEKPRTTLGWKGLINDPYLDESFQINDGLRKARHLLLDLAEMGVPAGTEFLDKADSVKIAEGVVAEGVSAIHAVTVPIRTVAVQACPTATISHRLLHSLVPGLAGLQTVDSGREHPVGKAPKFNTSSKWSSKWSESLIAFRCAVRADGRR